MRFPTRRQRTTAGLAALMTSALLTSTAACASGAEAPARTQSGVSAQTGTVQNGTGNTAVRVDVRREMRALEKKYESRIGAFALDTATGKSAGYRDGERFPLASTFKAFAAAALQHKARTTDPRLLDRVVHWTEDDILENSPVTELEENIRNGMTFAQLCHAAITVSDNTAANLILDEIGGPAALTRFFRSIGDPVSRLDRTEPGLNLWHPGEKRDTTQPAAVARSLQSVTVGRGLTAPDRAQLIGWLKDTSTGTARIKAGLPEGWTLGHKTGTAGASNYGAANDVAIAWSPASSAVRGGTTPHAPRGGSAASEAPVFIAVYTNRVENGRENDDAAIASATAVLIRALGRS
ncbi:class A beta-lactamase [Spirillospora sp. NPDC047279]|uniref:class A beta-lactamase n=1 Tax=Spirillospora sp. NPDC047279 TaxID=3155478 RepID=UPI0033CEFD35